MGEEPKMNTSPTEAEGALTSVEDMYTKGQLPPDRYYQCLVTLASEFLCRHHDADRALVLLNRCPSEYFTNGCLRQMQEEELFAATTVELGYKLIQLGIAEESETVPNLPPASA